MARKQYTPQFKAKLVLEVFQGEKELRQRFKSLYEQAAELYR